MNPFKCILSVFSVATTKNIITVKRLTLMSTAAGLSRATVRAKRPLTAAVPLNSVHAITAETLDFSVPQWNVCAHHLLPVALSEWKLRPHYWFNGTDTSCLVRRVYLMQSYETSPKHLPTLASCTLVLNKHTLDLFQLSYSTIWRQIHWSPIISLHFLVLLSKPINRKHGDTISEKNSFLLAAFWDFITSTAPRMPANTLHFCQLRPACRIIHRHENTAYCWT